MKKRQSLFSVSFDIINTIFMVLIFIIMFYPFLYVINVSISNSLMVKGGLMLWPHGLSLQSYIACFSNSETLNGLFISCARTIIGSVITLFVTCMGAYALTKRKVPGVNFSNKLFIYTMYISGGLIPYYLVIKYLGMVGTFWVYVIPSMVSVFGLIVIKTFIETLPASLEESAFIDGANELIVFWRIIFPMCMPVVAAIAMFTLITQWNSYFDTMMFNSMNRKLYTLQFYLYMILTSQNVTSLQAASEIGKAKNFNAQTVTMAVTVITLLPIMLIFPFIQKYFRSGLLIGAVKA